MRLRIFLTCLVLVLGFSTSELQASLVAHYTFDDGTFDDSVGGYNGAGAGDATVVPDPERGMVLSLDGADDWVDIPATVNYGNEFTVTMWIYTNVDLSSTQFAGGLNTDSWSGGIHFKLNYGTVNIGVNGGPADAAGTTVIPINTWAHIAATLTATGYKVYYNGVEEGTQALTSPLTAGLNAANIGSWNDGRELNGMIDDVRIYDHALTEDEIKMTMVPPGASDPDPDDEDIVLANQIASLSWANADDTNFCNVYFAKEDVALDVDGDPNRDRMDMLTFDPPVITVNIDDFASYSTPLVEGKYLWVVDCNVPGFSIAGDIWEFTVASNVAPIVDAGDSIVTWLDMAQAGFALDGTVTDGNGPGDIASIQWEAIGSAFPSLPAPDVSFDDDSDPDTTVTIGAVGEYILELTATDTASHEVSDAMQIIVYADACEAAQNSPDGYTPLEFDFDGNCQEDLLDFAMFAAKWLEANFLTDNVPFDAGALFTGPDLELWLDASDATTLTINVTPDGEQVQQWDDKTGSGKYLVPGGTAGDPNYVAAGLNGQGVVDLGPYMADQSGNWDLGKWMQFKDAQDNNLDISNIRTAFFVLKGYNFLLTDNNSYHFHRGGETATANLYSNNTHANIRNGATYINGLQVDGTTTGLPADYSVISVATTGNVTASTLCSDRNQYRSGGQKIAEIIIFNRALDDEERQIIENYLKTKWGI